MRRVAVLAAIAFPAPAAAAPAPVIVASTTAGPAPLSVRFQADVPVTGLAPGVVSYTWSFGDGTRASGPSVAHRFVTPGRYPVTLTVADALGGTGSATTEIRAQGLRLALAPPRVVFGRRVVARGALVPPARGEHVVLERRVGTSWQAVKSARTDGLGRFNAGLQAGRSGLWRARIGLLRSRATRLTVLPQVDVSAGPGTAFLGASLLVRARPQRASGVAVTLLRGGQEVGHARGTAGRRFTVPTPGIGTFAARIELAGRILTVPLHATARTLAPGSAGPDVLALRKRLAQLRVHVPAPSATFDAELSDAVVAFQKARGLTRSGVADEATWRALGQEVVPAPRYRLHGDHIEVSKSRQILLVVHDGETVAYLPVSSGAGGITPAGSYRILWKALATTTWLGPAILYRTMTFHTHYAIHGFPSVPAYPASHGCVRIPIWAADWLYRQSPVGERVYVYE